MMPAYIDVRAVQVVQLMLCLLVVNPAVQAAARSDSDSTAQPSICSTTSDDGVGVIADFRGKNTDYRLTRSGNECEVQYFMLLHEDDRIAISSLESLLMVRFFSGQSREYQGIGEHIISLPVPRDSGYSHKIVAELLRVFGKSKSDKTVPTGARGDFAPLALNWVGGDSVALIGAGRRSFALSWRGGVPPYEVALQLTGETTPRVYEQQLPKARLRITSAEVELVAGRGVVTVTDHAGDKVEGEIIVVDRARIPAWPVEDFPRWMTSEMKLLSRAARLSEAESGVWAFEALLQLAERARNGNQIEALMWSVIGE